MAWSPLISSLSPQSIRKSLFHLGLCFISPLWKEPATYSTLDCIATLTSALLRPIELNAMHVEIPESMTPMFLSIMHALIPWKSGPVAEISVHKSWPLMHKSWPSLLHQSWPLIFAETSPFTAVVFSCFPFRSATSSATSAPWVDRPCPPLFGDHNRALKDFSHSPYWQTTLPPLFDATKKLAQWRTSCPNKPQ